MQLKNGGWDTHLLLWGCGPSLRLLPSSITPSLTVGIHGEPAGGSELLEVSQVIRAPVSLARERLFVQAVYRQVENKTKPVLPGPMASSQPYKTQMCDRGEGSLVPLQNRSYMGWGGDCQMHRSRK